MINIKNVLFSVSVMFFASSSFAVDFNENVQLVNDSGFNAMELAYVSSQGEKNMIKSIEELNDEIFMGKEDSLYHVIAYRQKLVGGAIEDKKTIILDQDIGTTGKEPLVLTMLKGFSFNSKNEYGGKDYHQTSVGINNVNGNNQITLSAIQYFPEGLYMNFEKKDIEAPMRKGEKTEVKVVSELKSELNDIDSGKKYIDTFQITKLN